MEGPVKAATEKKSNKPDDYEIKDAVNTLVRAEEIKNDERLWPYVEKELGKKVKAIKSLDDLRKVADDFEPEETEDED